MSFLKRIYAVAAALSLAAPTGAFAAMTNAQQSQYKSAVSYTLSQSVNKDGDFIGGEWQLMALARGEGGLSREYAQSYYNSLVQKLKASNGILSANKYTEYSRTVLALSAMGMDAANVGGYNIIQKLADYNRVTAQGVNGAAFALLALNSGGYAVPKAEAGVKRQATKELYISFILSKQLDDGGFAMSGSTADVDVTAMAVQALSRHMWMDEVKSSVDRALDCLSRAQGTNGGYASRGTVNCESAAQVVIALAELGIDADTDPRFIKNGISVLDNVFSYYKDGGFSHTKGGAINSMATEQALCAASAYYRQQNGSPTFYTMK